MTITIEATQTRDEKIAFCEKSAKEFEVYIESKFEDLDEERLNNAVHFFEFLWEK